ncbi:hypothetical protein [Algibacter sp. 2305UL17-15]|uniref:hypothetical protein n=1 Tax=Algibacter sp. 2305UL17-15 TaxID=3231268 RepID=UPI00345B18DB
MSTIKRVCEVSYFGLMNYVLKKNLIDYQNEFSKRKGFTTKFALKFFPKYINFQKAIKKPVEQYDVLLLNYWIIEVPNNGLKWSKLISDYEFGKNSLINQRLKAEKKQTKTRAKLLLTKKQKQEIRNKKLDLFKEPTLQGEVIKRMKTDPEYAKKIKAIALKNSEKKSNYTDNVRMMSQIKKPNN